MHSRTFCEAGSYINSGAGLFTYLLATIEEEGDPKTTTLLATIVADDLEKEEDATAVNSSSDATSCLVRVSQRLVRGLVRYCRVNSLTRQPLFSASLLLRAPN